MGFAFRARDCRATAPVAERKPSAPRFPASLILLSLPISLALTFSAGHHRGMKRLLTAGILAGFVCSSALASTPGAAQGRRVQDLNVISTRVLQRSINPKFYQTLLVSPIDGWIVVRASVVNTRLSGARVVRSELNGAYDQLALQLANDLEIAGLNRTANPRTAANVLVHLLVYHTADGTMVLSFPTFDGAGGSQMRYWGCARLAVIKNGDGRWVEIEGPEGLHAKGWAVRDPTQVYNNDTPAPRGENRRPKFSTPRSSALGPIIASTKR
jgi:hypothetical protein